MLGAGPVSFDRPVCGQPGVVSPLVVPVNYSVEDGPSIVFRSGAGEKLNAATEEIVGIQVDEIDPFHQIGWSVLVEGSARWHYEEQVDVDVRAGAGRSSLHRSGHSDARDRSADPADPGRHRQPWLPLIMEVDVAEAIKRRRMVRAYDTRSVADQVLAEVLDAARRAPSAGLSQPVDLLVLTEKADREAFWDLAFPVRDGYDWPHLFDSPVVVVPLVEPAAYLRRYAQPDKAAAGLTNLEDWPVPYWWIDGGPRADPAARRLRAGLGSSLFGLFVNEAEILRTFRVPARHRALGE